MKLEQFKNELDRLVNAQDSVVTALKEAFTIWNEQDERFKIYNIGIDTDPLYFYYKSKGVNPTIGDRMFLNPNDLAQVVTTILDPRYIEFKVNTAADVIKILRCLYAVIILAVLFYKWWDAVANAVISTDGIHIKVNNHNEDIMISWPSSIMHTNVNTYVTLFKDNKDIGFINLGTDEIDGENFNAANTLITVTVEDYDSKNIRQTKVPLKDLSVSYLRSLKLTAIDF